MKYITQLINGSWSTCGEMEHLTALVDMHVTYTISITISYKQDISMHVLPLAFYRFYHSVLPVLSFLLLKLLPIVVSVIFACWLLQQDSAKPLPRGQYQSKPSSHEGTYYSWRDGS